MTLLLLLLACPEPPADTDPTPPQPEESGAPHTDPPETDPPHTDPPDPTGSRLVELGVLTCANPAARAAAPYDATQPGGDWAAQPYDPRSPSLFVGGGVTVADLDGDDRLDVVLTAYDTQLLYLVQEEGYTFRSRSIELPEAPPKTVAATPVDYDGDGDLDLHVTAYQAADLLLQNDGTGLFFNRAYPTGLADDDIHRTMAASWADWDRDGDLDPFVAGYGRTSGPNGLPPGDPSRLYRHDDGDVFVDLVPGRPAPDPLLDAHTFAGTWTDPDADGWPELFLVNDFGWTWPTTLLDNQQGAFSWLVNAGVESRLENMGIGVGDLNGDQIDDFLVTAWDGFRLFESDDGQRWFETSRRRGLKPDVEHGQNVAWGAELGDVDNDGDLDAAVVFGHLAVGSNNVNPEAQPDALFLQQPDGSFVDVAPAWGLADPARNRGLLLVDLDHDGWLDLIRTDLRGPARVERARCGPEAWLEVSARQPGMNPFAIGARITIVAGGQTWVRDLRAGGTSYASAGPPEVHFGLGLRDRVDAVEIRWPDGGVDRFTGVTARQRLRVERAP